MKTIEEMRKALLVAKETIEENLERLNRLEEEEEPVTLRIEPEREKEITIPQSSLCDMGGGGGCIKNWDDITEPIWLIATKRAGPLAGKAFILNDAYDWQLGKDESGILCLVPLKKDK